MEQISAIDTHLKNVLIQQSESAASISAPTLPKRATSISPLTLDNIDKKSSKKDPDQRAKSFREKKRNLLVGNRQKPISPTNPIPKKEAKLPAMTNSKAATIIPYLPPTLALQIKYEKEFLLPADQVFRRKTVKKTQPLALEA